MSLLNKHPFLNSVLDDLSDEELESLQTLIDGTGPSTFVYRSLVNVNSLLSADDKLTYGVNLELSKKKGIVSGWFLGTSFIQFYANRPEMQMYEINLEDYTYEVVDEPFTATDLRQAIDAKLGGGGGGGITVPTFTAITFEIELPDVDIELSSADCVDILQNQYPIITISHVVSAEETYTLTFVRNNSNSGIEKGEPYTNIQYDIVIDDDEDVYLVGLSFSDNDMKSWCMKINGEGGGSGTEEIYPINILATPSSTNIELAPAQNITLQDMGEQAPGYTAAQYTLNPGLSYTKPYDAVLAEFGAGHQYLLPLISADSSMLMYGISEGSMPVFDDDHPCAILIQLNNGAIDGVMMISGGTYGPDGTLVATSLKGYFYSDAEFSFNASGIRDTNIATAISAGKIPVAIINWQYKDFESWCLIKSFDEEDYYFEGEYKENKFTLVCDGSYWRVDWETPNVKDVELIADVDYANNKVYFRSLNNLREAQESNKLLRLKLYDNTSHDYLGNIQFTLASQNAAGTTNRYTSTEIVNGDIKIKTLVISSADTLVGGSAIYVQENEYYDFDEADLAVQAKLAEVYNKCPQILRVSTTHDGLQMYRLQNDYRAENDKLYYSCLLFGTLVELEFIDSSGTYSINITHYGLTPSNSN